MRDQSLLDIEKDPIDKETRFLDPARGSNDTFMKVEVEKNDLT